MKKGFMVTVVMLFFVFSMPFGVEADSTGVKEGVAGERERFVNWERDRDPGLGVPIVVRALWEQLMGVDNDYVSRRDASSLRLPTRRYHLRGKYDECEHAHKYEYSLRVARWNPVTLRRQPGPGGDSSGSRKRVHMLTYKEREQEALVLIEQGRGSVGLGPLWEEKRVLRRNYRMISLTIPVWLQQMLPRHYRMRVLTAAAMIGACTDGRAVVMPQTSARDAWDSVVQDHHTPYGVYRNIHNVSLRLHPTELLRLRAFGREMNVSSLPTVLRTAVMVGLGLPGAKLGLTTAPWLWLSKSFPRRFDLDFLKCLLMIGGTMDELLFMGGGCLLYDLLLEERLRVGGRMRLFAALRGYKEAYGITNDEAWSVRLLEMVEYNLWRHVQALERAAVRASASARSRSRGVQDDADRCLVGIA